MTDQSSIYMRHLGTRANLIGQPDSLAAIIPDPIENGALCFVTETGSYYQWVRGDTSAQALPQIVKSVARPNAGSWLQLDFGGIPFANQFVQQEGIALEGGQDATIVTGTVPWPGPGYALDVGAMYILDGVVAGEGGPPILSWELRFNGVTAIRSGTFDPDADQDNDALTITDLRFPVLAAGDYTLSLFAENTGDGGSDISFDGSVLNVRVYRATDGT